MTSAEEIRSLSDPAVPVKPETQSTEELQGELGVQVETCRDLMRQIQDVLFELRTLLNGSLDCLLVCEQSETSDVEAMENLRDLLEEEDRQEEEKHVVDQVIIRSRVSGIIRTILINMFSGYKEAVNTLIENLNKLLQEFSEEYDSLMSTYQKLLNKVAKTNLEKFLKGSTTDRLPQLFTKNSKENPKRLPHRINLALLTPEILEEQLRRYYKITSSDQPPRRHPRLAGPENQSP